MRHEYWRHHLSDHNSATSGIAPLGYHAPVGRSAGVTAATTDTLAGLLTVRDSGRNGRQSSQGWAARREAPPGQAKYPPMAACQEFLAWAVVGPYRSIMGELVVVLPHPPTLAKKREHNDIS
jgi:hypothetical protein